MSHVLSVINIVIINKVIRTIVVVSLQTSYMIISAWVHYLKSDLNVLSLLF